MLRLTSILFALSIIGLIALYVFEFRWFDRTIDMRRLAFYALAAGALAGMALGRRFQHQGRSSVEKVQLYVFFIVICTLFAPLFASLSNRLLSFAPPRARQVQFFEEKAYASEPYGLMKGEKPKPAGYYSFFYYEGRLRRIKSTRPMFAGLERGETASLPMKRGLWGFEVVVGPPVGIPPE